MRTLRSAAMMLGATMLLAGSGAARADTATCDVPIVHAQPGAGEMQLDPKIDHLKPYLSKAPFTAWHDFQLLDRKTLTLQPGGSATFMTLDNRPATLTFIGHTGGSGEHRMHLKLVVDRPEKHNHVLDTTFTLDEGGVMLNVWRRHDKDVIILAVSCKTQN